MGAHLSVRLDDDLLSRLETESRRSGQSRSELARRLLEEGLCMERHPGIVFRSGPGGRRASLVNGPDVWEVVRAVPPEGVNGEDARAALCERTGLSPIQVREALRYYAAYPDEIDDWLRRLDEVAEEAEEGWQRARRTASG